MEIKNKFKINLKLNEINILQKKKRKYGDLKLFFPTEKFNKLMKKK